MQQALLASAVSMAAGHGHMTHPPTRDGSTLATAGNCKLPNEPRDLTPEDGQCRWFSQGGQPGCDVVPTDGTQFGPNPCKTPMEPTVTDPMARTWDYGGDLDWTKYNPWRSPGFAPILSPCGIAGGGPTYHPENGALPPKGIPMGTDGRDLPELDTVMTEWPQGSAQEVAWSVHANHGGGYAYRLCPRDREATEECFQQHHLQFDSDQSWIQYGADTSNRTAFTAYRITEGTNPKGSQWTRGPIPACGDASGGEGCAETWGEAVPGCGPNPGDKNSSRGFVCTEPPMFKPPLPGLFGYGWSACFSGCGDGKSVCSREDQELEEAKFKFNIIDRVVIPEHLPVGQYMLSFRWDCEQTPQIWAQCADVTITKGAPLQV